MTSPAEIEGLPTDRPLVPIAIWRRGGYLCWEGRRLTNRREDQNWDGLLERFASLRDATDEAVMDFSTRYGVLEICTHDRPASHSRTWDRPCAPRRLAASDRTPWNLTLDEEATAAGREPFAVWRRLAEQADAALMIATALHLGHMGDPALWATLSDPMPPAGAKDDAVAREQPATPEASDNATLVREAKRRLAAFVDRWLDEGGVRPLVFWSGYTEHRSSYRWAAGLYGSIGIQLMLTVMNE
jgi:hypothetical protein